MKLLFINIAYPKEIYQQLKEDAQGILQVSCDVFQWAVIDGLELNGVYYTLASVPALPAWPCYKHLFTPKGEMMVNGKPRGHYLSYCDAPAVKQLSQRRVLRNYVKLWCEANRNEDCLAVLTYTQQAELLGAAIDLKEKFPNLVVAPIVTDLIENALDFASNRTLLKKFQVKMEAQAERNLFAKVDKFVLLTSQMTECIPEAKGKYMVMEGVASCDNISPKEKIEKSEGTRTLLYTGTFQEYGGLRMLVDAFLQTKDPTFRLILCGNGLLRQYVEKASETDSRIIYKGLVTHDEVIKYQHESTLLVNPRRPNGSITKYSFPSKTMEYMTSGTPMIGYHLEGIPEEYYQYMYTPVDLSQEALTDCINSTLSLSLETLHNQGKMALNFVSMYKNSEAQVRRVIDFLNSKNFIV